MLADLRPFGKLARLLPVLVLATAGCPARTAAPITIGHVSDQNDTSQGNGKQAILAIRLALEEEKNRANAEAAPRPIQVRHTDTQGELDAFAAQAVRLVTVSDAIALIGGVTAEEVEQLDRGLAPVIALAGMRTPRMGERVFLTGLAPEFRGQVAAAFVVQELKAAYVLEIVDRREESAKRISSAFGESIAYPKTEPLQHRSFAIISDADIIRAAERVQRTKPDAVVFAGKMETLVEIQRNLAQPMPAVLASRPTRELLDRLQSDIYLITAFADDDTVPSIQTFREAYRGAFAVWPGERAALAYDAMRLLSEALRQTPPPFAPDQLAEQLARIKNFAGITGELTFADNGQLQRPAFVVRIDPAGYTTLVRRYLPDQAAEHKETP